jgi:hypothetical protein
MDSASAAAYVVFDLLARNGKDLRNRPYWKRRRKLEKLLGGHLPDGLVSSRHRRPAVARSWMLAHTSTGLEGFVAKRLDQPYRPGQRGWQKSRTRITAEAVVGGGNRVTEHPPHEGIVSASSIRTPCSVCARTSGCTGPEGGARRRPGGPRSRSGFAERRNSSPAARTTAGRRTRARVHARRGRRASGGAGRSECRDGDRGRARRVPAGATWLRGPDVDGPGRP